MLPLERKKQILIWLEEERVLRVSDVSKKLGVSEMTVYRDINSLIVENKVLKTSNGITLVNESMANSAGCIYCQKEVHSRLSVQLMKMNQQVEQACCLHCGLLRYKDIRRDVKQILIQDFLYNATISAVSAVYLMNTDLHLNCCQPQIIPFLNEKQAIQFQLGFGGEIYHFEEAIQAIQESMHHSSCCQHN